MIPACIHIGVVYAYCERCGMGVKGGKPPEPDDADEERTESALLVLHDLLSRYGVYAPTECQDEINTALKTYGVKAERAAESGKGGERGC